MLRCPSCGRRVLGADCHIHGRIDHILPDPESPPLPELRGYRVDRLLGRGGFGWVFAAEQMDSGQKVAVKVARNDVFEAVERLEHEVNAIRRIGPPHVPTIFESGTLANGIAFFAMEYIDDASLAERLAAQHQDGPLGFDVFLLQAHALLDAVEAVHRADIVHRDLKPENIFLGDSPWRATLIDFGLAVVASSGGTMDSELRALGTAEYMAPEQCEAGTPVDRRADIYALGILFFEMLAGRPPFFGKWAEVSQAHRQKRPPAVSSFVAVPAGLEAVIMRCLAKEPSDRYATVLALREDLDRQTPQVGSAEPQASELVPDRAKPAAGAQARKRRTVAMISFESSAGAAALKTYLATFGAQLVYFGERRHVGVFDHEAGLNPARRALQAAEGLIAGGLTGRVLIDMVAAIVQTSRHGARRFLSPSLGANARMPPESAAEGMFLTKAASAMLADAPTVPVPLHEDLVRCIPVKVRSEEVTGLDHTLLDRGIPLVGREDILEILVGSAREAFATSQPTIATVIADTGYGKSHICAELMRRLRSSVPAHFIGVRAREPIGGNAEETLRELLRVSLVLPMDPPEDLGRARLIDKLGSSFAEDSWVAIAFALGWLPADAYEVQRLRSVPGALRSVLVRAVGLALQNMAQEAPMVVLLDDAQFADQTTLDILEYATLSEHQVGIWVCVLARQTLLDLRPEWGSRAAVHRNITLGPLDDGSAAELCRLLLLPADLVPRGAIDALVARSQKIPMLLVELVLGLKENGLVRQQQPGVWYVATDEIDRVPNLPLVEWIATVEVDKLPGDLAAHARLVALLGPEFLLEEAEGVVKALDRLGQGAVFPLDPKIAIKWLTSKEFLVAHRDGRFGFRHALLREAIAKATAPEVRKEVHEAAFEYYSRRGNLPEEYRLSRLAHHAAQAGQRDQAAAVYLSLAERADARHDYLEAERLYTRAIEQMEVEDPRLLHATRGRGLMRYRLARYADSLSDLAIARRAAKESGDALSEIELLLDEATVLDWCDEWRASQERVEEAQARSAQVRTPRIAARLLMARGRSACRQNQNREAAELLDAAAAEADKLGDDGYETLVISLLLGGYLYAVLSRLDEAEARFNQVIPLCEVRGDLLHLAAAYGNRTIVWIAKGAREPLLSDLRRLLHLARELGNGRLEQHAHYYLGLYLHWLGEGEAEHHARRAVAIDERRFAGSDRHESWLLLARILAWRGELAEAQWIIQKVKARLHPEAGGGRAALLPSEENACEMVELAVETRPDDAASGGFRQESWQALCERSSAIFANSEMLELFELWAKAALRAGFADLARDVLARAVAKAETATDVMHEQRARLQDALRALAVS